MKGAFAVNVEPDCSACMTKVILVVHVDNGDFAWLRSGDSYIPF
jgi:hypothetical protein